MAVTKEEKMRKKKALIVAGIVLCGLVLSACGLFNRPPVAVIEAEPTSGPAPLTVTFDGSTSYDPDGTITYYLWLFGDYQTSSETIVTHTYPTAGTFVVTLAVEDAQGVRDQENATILVTPPEG